MRMTDEALWVRTKELALRERAATVELLEHLREVDARKLWATRGYGSLFEYVRRELGYSEGAAHRRIQAMRVLRALPEVAGKIESGQASLCSLASFQGYVKEKAFSVEEKRELLSRVVEGRSRRETEQLLGDLSPQVAPAERERVISSELTQITLTADRALLDKLEQLRSLLAHRNPDASYLELIHMIADIALKALTPAKPKSASIKAAAPALVTKAETLAANAPVAASPSATPPAEKPRVTGAAKFARVTRFIPAEVRRTVWHRDQGKCTYPGCGSRFMLEYDHVMPHSTGGASTVENLRLLCRTHNQLKGDVPVVRFSGGKS